MCFISREHAYMYTRKQNRVQTNDDVRHTNNNNVTNFKMTNIDKDSGYNNDKITLGGYRNVPTSDKKDANVR